MAALLANANNQTAAATVAGASESTQIICSGDFTGSARCLIELSADGLDYATVYEFHSEGSIILSAKTGTTIRAAVYGGDTTNTSIDVSVL